MNPKNTMFTFLLVTLFFNTFAQKAPIKFGDVTKEELEMTKYEADTSAAAIILIDYGNAYINSAANMIFEHTRRIKILKKEGLQDWADYSVLLYSEGSTREIITGLKAVTYNLENGKIVESKMDKDAVFDEKVNKYYNRKKFTLPNVKEGSVIEFTYKLNSDFLSNFPNWKFQSTIPIVWSEYRAAIPEFFIYEKYMQGYIPLATVESKTNNNVDYKETANRWVAKNVPAFREEPFMTSDVDYISRINFALSHISFPGRPVQEIMGSWEKMNKDYLESEYFGKVVSGSGFLKKTVDELTKGVNDPNQKIEIIYKYIKESIKYNDEEDKTIDSNIKKVFDAKTGNSAEINLALASMLRKAGLEVDPVLLSTRDHGFIRPQYPMTKQFNYVICAVKLDGKTLLLDATEEHLPLSLIPERCLNGQGLVISEKNFGWINLETTTRSSLTAQVTMDIEEDQFKGKIELSKTGYYAHNMRKEYITDGEEEFIKEVKKDKGWEIESSEFAGIKELENVSKETYTVTVDGKINVANDILYIDPFITAKQEENFFKLEKREYPVDFGSPFHNVYMITINIPENYQIDETPEAKVIALPGNAGRFMYNVAQSGKTITITNMITVNKALFSQDEYPALREFYNLIVAKQAEQVVLKKI